jgi:hypothetical protein
MRLLVFGAIVLGFSMTLHLHRWTERQSARFRRIENDHEVSEISRRQDTINSDRQEMDTNTARGQETSNRTRIAYLTYTHLQGGPNRFHELTFPSLDTWVPADEPYYIILSEEWRSTYDELVITNSNFSLYKSRMHPIFVPCPEGKTLDSECCKQEQGMLHMIIHYDYDWLIYLDDDNYVRSNYMRDFLTNLSTSEIMVLTSGPTPRFLGIFGYLPQKSPYKCLKDPDFTYPWGQAVAYNRATQHHLQQGLRLKGLLKQCRTYRVHHDVGNALFHFMYNLPEIRLRISDRPSDMRDEYLGAHGVGRCPHFKCDMLTVHTWYSSLTYQPPVNHSYVWRNASGFFQTATYKMYGAPSNWTTEWHTMPVEDCLGPKSFYSSSANKEMSG